MPLPLLANVKQLLAQDKTEEALKILKQNYLEHQIIITLSARFNRLKKRLSAGLITNTDYDVSHNAINHDLLVALETIESEPKNLDVWQAFDKDIQRYKHKMYERYDVIRVFGMREPIPLSELYVKVQILEKITSRIRVSSRRLEKHYDKDKRRLSKKQTPKAVKEIVDLHNRFIILGQPGAGKTTLLKYIALQSLQKSWKKNRLPIFITLKLYADSDLALLDYIISQFDNYGFSNAPLFVKAMLQQGNCQLLLDGLDEVSQKKQGKVIEEIISLTNQYSDNQFAISCRIAAYNYWFEHFMDMEVADFDHGQIKAFIQRWFKYEAPVAKECWRKLQEIPQLQELATSPLLLTMLCLTFDENYDFPVNRAELYKEAIDALLKKWDSSRRIKRDEIYKKLSLRRKEVMLSELAYHTFKEGQFFLPKRVLTSHIRAFIQNLPDTEANALDIDSENVLNAIEAQHGVLVQRAKGVYSFSHLTFQEYFTAQYVVDNADAFTRLISYIDQPQWREVFLLTVSMLNKSDYFFLALKAEINTQVDNYKHLKDLLQTISLILKTKANTDNKKGAFDRSVVIYIIVLLTQDLIQDVVLTPELLQNIAFNLDRTRARTLSKIRARILAHAPNIGLDIDFDLDLARACSLNLALDDSLIKQLSIYLSRNKLLIDCLNTECYVSTRIREQIYEELLSVPS